MVQKSASQLSISVCFPIFSGTIKSLCWGFFEQAPKISSHIGRVSGLKPPRFFCYDSINQWLIGSLGPGGLGFYPFHNNPFHKGMIGIQNHRAPNHQLTIKVDSIKHLSNKKSTHVSTFCRWKPGACVRIKGLQVQKNLNGLCGSIVDWDTNEERWKAGWG